MFERALVTGAAGMLGTALVPKLGEIAREVIATDVVPGFRRLDVSRSGIVEYIKTLDPDLIVHLAALTDLERCEKETGWAEEINTWGMLNVARGVSSRTRIVYVSTAGVFDGLKGYYYEGDVPHPINRYGMTKLRGEHIVLGCSENALIVRAGWMFGGGPGVDHKFVGMICRQIAEGATEIRAVDDKTGSPTYTEDLARAILTLLDRKATGIWHTAGKGVATRYDVAKCIVSALGRPDIEVIPVASEAFPQFPALRPDREDLCGGRDPHLMRSWWDALAEYLAKDWGSISVLRCS